MSLPHRTHGFTLIELLLVVVLLSVVAGLALPNFSQSFFALSFQDDVDSVAHLMRYAQMQAIQHEHQFVVEYTDQESPFFQLKQWNEASGTWVPFANRFGRPVSMDQHTDVYSDVSRIVFSPNGDIDEAHIVFQHNDDIRIVSTAHQSGYVHVLEGER